MFSFRDHLVTVTPVSGVNAGQPYRVLSGNKIGLDPGAKAKHVPGFSELPFDITRQSNEPKVSLEGMDADEVRAVREWVGNIGGDRFTISVVAQRPGTDQVRIRMIRCEWSGGGGWQAEEGGSMDKIEALAMDIHMAKGAAQLRSIYAQRHPR